VPRGAQVLLTLFIGIVATSMEESKEANAAENERAERLVLRLEVLGLDRASPRLQHYRDMFKILDKLGDFKVEHDQLKKVVPCLAAIHKERQAFELAALAFDEGDVAALQAKFDAEPDVLATMTRVDTEKLLHTLGMWDEDFTR